MDQRYFSRAEAEALSTLRPLLEEIGAARRGVPHGRGVQQVHWKARGNGHDGHDGEDGEATRTQRRPRRS